MANDTYKYFRIEARELVDGLNEAALALDKGESQRDAMAKLLRIAHTLKGAARVVRQNAIADLAHRIEERLGPYRASPQTVTREVVSRVLAMVDEVEAHLLALDAPPAEPSTRTEGPTAQAKPPVPPPSSPNLPS